MSKHHKHRNYGTQFSITSREGLTLEILALAEKAGAKAGYNLAKEELYRSIGSDQLLDEQQTDELLAAAERAGAAAALVAARKVLDKTLRTSFQQRPQPSTASPLADEATPANRVPVSESHAALRNKVDQHVLRITRVERLNDQMVRIIASAPNLDGYRSNSALDEYVKVFVADPALELVPPYDMRDLRRRLPREHLPRSKSYTIRWVDRASEELAIDFVLHSGHGSVGAWASTAKPGDPLVISAARSKTSFTLPDGPVIFAADEAGIPAVSLALKRLSEQAIGLVFLEVASAQDTFDIPHPAGVNLHWVSRDGALAGANDLLVHALDSLPRPDPRTVVIAHAERTAAKKISRLVAGWGLEKKRVNVSSYWTLRRSRD